MYDFMVDTREPIMKKRVFLILVFPVVLAAPYCFGQQSEKHLSSQEAIKQMGRGINVGNTLDPPTEGEWNNPPIKENIFDDYKNAGFTCVRIPIRWDKHTENSPPYAIDEKWLARVEQIVDWALSRDLFVIINSHHDNWIKEHYKDPVQRERFDSIWRQISRRFQNKSGKLVFEILNEPENMDQQDVDDMNQRVLKIIRESNPTRLVIFTGNKWSESNQLLSAAAPKDDYLIATFHMYLPQDQKTWGTEADKKAVINTFDKVSKWSEEHKVPVILGEFGAISQIDHDSRMKFYKTVVAESLARGFAFNVWDDGANFQVYKRTQRDWNEIKDILINTPPSSSTTQ
jgi:aryl-phospho-beta-D-glucosidase BglC (GH1 family)